MECIALRQKLHKIPEKSFCEEKTKEALQDWLWEHTDSEVVDRGRWFYAVKKGRTAAGPALYEDGRK